MRKGFEERLPFKSAYLNNKTRNSVLVEKLSAEFIITTDPRLRSRFPQEQLLFWFREPYATVVLVSCEVFWNLLPLLVCSECDCSYTSSWLVNFLCIFSCLTLYSNHLWKLTTVGDILMLKILDQMTVIYICISDVEDLEMWQ